MLWVTLLLSSLGMFAILSRQGNRMAAIALVAILALLLTPLTYFRLNNWPRLNGRMSLFLAVVIICLLWAVLIPAIR